MTASQEGSSTALAQIALNSRLKFRLRAKAVKMELLSINYIINRGYAIQI